MTQPADIARDKPTRRPFFIILGLFFMPLALAFIVYYGSGWRPSGTTNKGDLISPAIPLPTVTLNTVDGQQTDARFLREDWSLVYLGEGQCTEPCRSSLLQMRLAFQLLGKDMTRVKRVFLYTGIIEDKNYFATEQGDLLSASIDDAQGQQLTAGFPASNGVPAIQAGRIYIVDPLGNLMMSYAQGTDARNVYQDLKKLLGLSHIG